MIFFNKKKKSSKGDMVSSQIDILCSIWILACNDDNPQITYAGIINRLGLPDNYDIKSIVHSRGELFRKRTTQVQLDNWKDEMRNGKRLPNFLKDKNDKDERDATISALTIHDVFRSQFRPEANSPRSSIDIIDWGLQHLERLRKASIEIRQEKARNFTSIILPAISSFIAIIAIISSLYSQHISNENQIFIKEIEFEIKPRQEKYKNYVETISQSYFAALNSDSNKLAQSFDQLETSFYFLATYLNETDRKKIQQLQTAFMDACIKVSGPQDNKKQLIDSIGKCKKSLRESLYLALFISPK